MIIGRYDHDGRRSTFRKHVPGCTSHKVLSVCWQSTKKASKLVCLRGCAGQTPRSAKKNLATEIDAYAS